MDSYNERYFYLSGLLSLGMFAGVIALIGYFLLTTTKIEHFSMFQSDFVSVSIAITDKAARSETAAKPAPKEVKSEPEEAAPPPQAPETAPDISDLFSSVKSPAEPKKERDRSKRNEDLLALEKEVMASERKERLSDKVAKVELRKPGMRMEVQGGSTGPIVNKYHAKIQALIYTQFTPPPGSEGQAVRVLIQISSQGRLLSYRVMAYSANTALNSEVDWLGERLREISFPQHPENKDTVLNLILTAKE